MDLVDAIHDVVLTFPSYELYALSSQMRRAAYSIPLNIAEGRGRGSFRDNRGFLRKARASGLELETALELSRRRRYISDETEKSLRNQTLRVVQLINGLIRDLTSRIRAEKNTTRVANPGDRRPATRDPNPESKS
jgi:four helix bundle protein